MKKIVFLPILILLTSCSSIPKPQKGGKASITSSPSGVVTATTVEQGENPSTPSTQTHEQERTEEFVVPAKSEVREIVPSVTIGPSGSTNITTNVTVYAVSEPMPVKRKVVNKTSTQLGAAQKDTARELGSRLMNMRPVMWVGIFMMTIVTGVLAYFQWWTKAGIAFGVGLAMVVLAQSLPGHEGMIIGFGLLGFAAMALLVLYAYHKGLLEKFIQHENPTPPPA